MTKLETAQLLALISTAYPGSKIAVDDMTVSLWHDMLQDLPGEVVATATKLMFSTLKFPPSIADIREAVAQATQDARGVLSAGDAWAKVCKAVSWFGYYRADEARAWLGDYIWRAVEMIGGWRELCAGEDSEGVVSAQFERRYNAMTAQQAQLVQIPASVRDDMARLVGPLVDKLMLTD